MELGDGSEWNLIPQKAFSDDVLKILILGPNQDHLSVVDVPGLFRTVTEGKTTKADRDMVKAMTMSYMKNERSIILTVVAANMDFATTEITDFAKECDPQGRRTLGVLTKPDLVDKGAEAAAIDILEGKAHPLRLGWCVVKNAGQNELAKSFEERRHDEEVFFKTKEPWTKLPRDRVGILFLRSRLAELHKDLVNREFSKVNHAMSIAMYS